MHDQNYYVRLFSSTQQVVFELAETETTVQLSVQRSLNEFKL